MSTCISAIGTANPEFRAGQTSILEFMVAAFGLEKNNAARLKQIYDHSGIENRYSVIPDFDGHKDKSSNFFSDDPKLEFPGTAERMKLYQDNALDLAVNASRNCFKQIAESITASITHLITVSCTGMYAPGLDIELVDKLGLRRDTERICINFMGCYGAMNALKTADYICRAEPDAKVLIVCVELCTIHFQKDNTLDNWVANSLFSDGAAAALIENSSSRKLPEAYFELGTFHSEFIPEARDEMGWYIGNTGFEMRLTSKISKLILKHLRAVADKLILKSGEKSGDIRNFAIHPGGRKILEAAEQALGFEAEKNRFAYEVLRDYGNMSSPTILFVLQKMLASKTPDHNENIMALAFGPGLTVESAILKKKINA